MHRTSGPEPRKQRILWWFLLPLLTLGMATFAVVGYAGSRLHSRWHRAAAVGYFLLFTGYFVGAQFADPGQSGVVDAIIVSQFLINWLVGSAHTCWLEAQLKSRKSSAERTSSEDPTVLAAQQRLARRQRARALLTNNPALAAELLIGRPDLGGHYDDGGLVDINHVPAEVIAQELRIPLPVAVEIVEQRSRIGGFQSTDDLVVYCETITPNQVSVVRDRLLFTAI